MNQTCTEMKTDTQARVPAAPVWKRWWNRYSRYFKENRTAERKSSGTAAEVWWTDPYGGRVLVRGVCIDLSSGGVGLVCPSPVPNDTSVHVKWQPDGAARSARLRHCQPCGGAYLMGFELL
jgi:hypothetical protein